MFKSIAPQDILFDHIVTDISFHPYEDFIASAEISGDAKLYRYNVEANTMVCSFGHHKKACRGVAFSQNGRTLYTISKDKSLCAVDVKKQSLSTSIKNAHSCAIYCIANIGDVMVATGDDDGYMKVWDMRTNKAVMEEKQNEDYISDIKIDKDFKLLFSTSGDGTLSVFNFKKRRFDIQSETCSTEMSSLSLMKNQTKVVCGTGNKALNIYTWGSWSDISDRFPGFKGSVDCMVPVNDDILCTGSSDGAIRAVHILPNRFLGIIGRHVGFPVEKLSLARSGDFLASCSHDQTIKFWDITMVTASNVDARTKANKKKNSVLNASKKDDFFSGLEEDETISHDSAKKEESSEEENVVDPTSDEEK